MVGDEGVLEGGVGGGGVAFDVDHEVEGGGAGGVDVAGVVGDALFEGVEVEGLEGAVGAELAGVVGDEEVAGDEVDVGFDAAEAVVEGVEEGAGVFVVVVGVGAGEGFGVIRCGGGGDQGDERGGEEGFPHTGRERSRFGVGVLPFGDVGWEWSGS